jgi:release factor glutamine methyltransferase
MTIQEAEKKIRTTLSKIYDEGESAAISDWVIEHETGAKRSEWLARPNMQLPVEKENILNSHLQKLLRHEPVQYVLNETWFCGLKFFVNNNVLIPRPETEELVEWVIANCKFPVDRLSILDIGSGSGCISVSLKRKLRKAEVWGCDVSGEALEVARRNASSLNAAVNYRHLDFLDRQLWHTFPRFDIIISNPPYVPESDKAEMQPNVLAHEPHTALFVPDENALIFYEAIAEFASSHLTENGTIYTEIHENLAQGVINIFAKHGFITEIKKDMQGKDRMTRSTRLNA